MATPEGIVVKAITQYLQLLENQGRIWFHRTNNNAVYDRTRKTFRTANGAGYKYGVPDIECVAAPNGVYIGIEVKSGKGGVQSDHQKQAEAFIRRVGGIYVLARSVDDVIKVFASF